MGLSEPHSVSAALLSTDSYVALGAIDVGVAKSLVMTIKVVTNNLHWKVQGANLSDFSDLVEVQAEATVNAGAVGSYSTEQALYRYYRGMIKAAAGGSQGTGTLTSVAKP